MALDADRAQNPHSNLKPDGLYSSAESLQKFANK